MRRNFRIRNRPVIVLLLPIVVILWMVGWVLYWKGSQGQPPRKIAVAVKDNGIEIGVAMLEEDVEVDG